VRRGEQMSEGIGFSFRPSARACSLTMPDTDEQGRPSRRTEIKSALHTVRRRPSAGPRRDPVTQPGVLQRAGRVSRTVASTSRTLAPVRRPGAVGHVIANSRSVLSFGAGSSYYVCREQPRVFASRPGIDDPVSDTSGEASTSAMKRAAGSGRRRLCRPRAQSVLALTASDTACSNTPGRHHLRAVALRCD